MVDGRRPSIGPGTAISADQVARRSFVTVRRGFDPNEVRAFLEWVAAGVDGAARREEELKRRLEEAEARIADAERRAANPTLDEPTLTAALGQETAKVLRSAHEAASELTARAEENAARLVRQAEEDAARLHERAASILSERTEEAEAAVSEMRRSARSETSTVVADARREAETMIERAREECREMVRETQELRARILGDLARRRRVLYTQVEQLRAGKGTLAETLTGVRRTVDQIQEGLRRAEEEARVAADTAARRVAGEPEPTGDELVHTARQLTERTGSPLPVEQRESAATTGAQNVEMPQTAPSETAPRATKPEPAARTEPAAAKGEPAAASGEVAGAPGRPPTAEPARPGAIVPGRQPGTPVIGGAVPSADEPTEGGELVRVIGAFPGRRPDGSAVAPPISKASGTEQPADGPPAAAPAPAGDATQAGETTPPEGTGIGAKAPTVPPSTTSPAPGSTAPGQTPPVTPGDARPAEGRGPVAGEAGGQNEAGASATASTQSRRVIPGRGAHPAVIAAERAAEAARRTESGAGDRNEAEPPAGEEAPVPASGSDDAEAASRGVAGTEPGAQTEAAASSPGAPGEEERKPEERRSPTLRLLRRARSGGRTTRGEEEGESPGGGGREGDASEGKQAGGGPDDREQLATGVAGSKGDAAVTGPGGPRPDVAGREAVAGREKAGKEKEGRDKDKDKEEKEKEATAEPGTGPAASSSHGGVPDEVGEEAVNALFARIRASRAATTPEGDEGESTGSPGRASNGRSGRGSDRGRSGGGARPGGRGRRSKRRAPSPQTADEHEGGAVATMERSADDSPPGEATEAPGGPQAVKPLSPDEEILERRDDAVEPIVIALSRKLKRALQDEQNELLDRMRSRPPKASPRDVLLGPREQKEHYWTVGLPFLKEAAMAGATFAGASEGMKVPDSAADGEAAELAAELVAPLRRRIENGLDDLTAGDDAALMDHVGAAYREWKGQRVETLAGDHVTAAFSRGELAVTPEGTKLRWIVDDDGVHCPDCDDNALAGPLRRGERYPTGQVHPPAHSGCRCLLTASPT